MVGDFGSKTVVSIERVRVDGDLEEDVTDEVLEATSTSTSLESLDGPVFCGEIQLVDDDLAIVLQSGGSSLCQIKKKKMKRRG